MENKTKLILAACAIAVAAVAFMAGEKLGKRAGCVAGTAELLTILTRQEVNKDRLTFLCETLGL